MSQFTLYSHRGPGPNPLKAAILLEKLGLTYDVVALDFGNDPEKGVKSEKFLKLNPNGRVPALVDHKNGDFTVWESGAILYYLVEQYDQKGEFFGKDVKEKTVTMQWLTHQLSGLGPVQGNVNYAHHYWKGTYDEEPCKSVFTRFEGEAHRLYQLLDQQLGRQKYVALPDRATIADWSFYSWVNIASFGKLDISGYKNVVRWLDELRADKQIQAADDKLPKK
ncbi:unnamed protein product [Parajaminaea phylloscopi]